MTVGGQTPDGRDATNELTHLILKSKREFPLHYPDLAARIHSHSPESYLWDVAEALKVAQEDAMFYARSGGGMTISGGEPLLQSEFALNLLRLARERR
ncbi:pyruvate formate lyase family protein, partial [Desulfovibrio sp.]|uniref:pyruvate formate lyase family protein n=1 Tax=Desulfovibrio sp. TaxID=885 RepID=UPI00257A65D2